MTTWTYTSDSPADTERLGTALAKTLPDGMVVALSGTLGAGKTHLVRAIVSHDDLHLRGSVVQVGEEVRVARDANHGGIDLEDRVVIARSSVDRERSGAQADHGHAQQQQQGVVNVLSSSSALDALSKKTQRAERQRPGTGCQNRAIACGMVAWIKQFPQ